MGRRPLGGAPPTMMIVVVMIMIIVIRWSRKKRRKRKRRIPGVRFVSKLWKALVQMLGRSAPSLARGVAGTSPEKSANRSP